MGPGRIDPFNPVKFGMLGLPDDGTIGNSVMQAVWGLNARNAIRPNAPFALGWAPDLHPRSDRQFGTWRWRDRKGLQLSLHGSDRAVSEDQRTAVSPFKPDSAQVQRGQAVFTSTCADCHGP